MTFAREKIKKKQPTDLVRLCHIFKQIHIYYCTEKKSKLLASPRKICIYIYVGTNILAKETFVNEIYVARKHERRPRK